MTHAKEESGSRSRDMYRYWDARCRIGGAWCGHLSHLAHRGFSECCSSPVQNSGVQGDPLAHSMVIS